MLSVPAAALLAVNLLAAAQNPAPPPQPVIPARNLPISLARIREGLKRPELFLAARPRADFFVEINEKQRFQDLLALINFDSGPSIPGGWYSFQQAQMLGQKTQPLVSFNATGVAQAIGGAISQARRERAERLAREEVRRALVDFCTVNECPAR